MDGGALTDYRHELQALGPADRHPKALAVLEELAAAASFFHALPEPVVGRDLKPSNARRDGRGRVRVTGSGIGAAARQALLLDGWGQMTGGGRRRSYPRGSRAPLYASPEQKAGAEPDPRDGVHALVVIAYELDPGRLDRAPGARFDRELEAAGAPPGMVGLIGDGADDPHRRPGDGTDLADRLGAIKRAGGPAPVLPSPLEGEGGSARRAEPGEGKQAPPPPAHVAPPARKGGDEVHFPLPFGLKMTFCWVPPGACQLGSPLAERNDVIEAVGKRPDWLADESQAKRGVFTTKTGFWLAKYPVTQAEWHALTGESPRACLTRVPAAGARPGAWPHAPGPGSWRLAPRTGRPAGGTP